MRTRHKKQSSAPTTWPVRWRTGSAIPASKRASQVREVTSLASACYAAHGRLVLNDSLIAACDAIIAGTQATVLRKIETNDCR